VGPLSLGGLALVFGSAAALPCHAAGHCDLEVTGADTPAWRDAIGALDLDATDATDCAVIRLTVGGDISRLTFETNDGRVAERELRHPSELTPTLDALLVTGLPAAPEPEPEPEPKPEPEPELEPEPRPAPSPRPVAPRRGHLIDAEDDGATRMLRPDALTAAFSLQLGVRGGAGGLMSPVVYGQVTMDRSRWEIGVWGALEPEYGSFGQDRMSESAPPDVRIDMPPMEARSAEPLGPVARASAGVVGVAVGRRLPFTHLDLVLGGRVGVAAVRHFDQSNDAAEIRVGASSDLVFPRASTLRFRTGTGAELVPSELKRTGPRSVPSWALFARLGIEVGGS
jgi:hypothetical protein